MINTIRQKLSHAAMWEQLAEEASELSQAASKMARWYRGENPPAKDIDVLTDNVIEEHADVDLCFTVLGWNDKAHREQVKEMKLKRWASRIEGL